jgi:PTS system nitrogen regulatory IIA component
MNLSSFISTGSVIFPDATERDRIISIMAETAWKAGKIPDLDSFTAAVRTREGVMSTGVGLGVAVPHAKLTGIPGFFVVIAILSSPIDWEAIDDKPVRIVFLIGGPDNDQAAYLKILSKIILVVKNETRRLSLLACRTPEEVVALFAGL